MPQVRREFLTKIGSCERQNFRCEVGYAALRKACFDFFDSLVVNKKRKQSYMKLDAIQIFSSEFSSLCSNEENILGTNFTVLECVGTLLESLTESLNSIFTG